MYPLHRKIALSSRREGAIFCSPRIFLPALPLLLSNYSHILKSNLKNGVNHRLILEV
jgi:hypothetical protein